MTLPCILLTLLLALVFACICTAIALGKNGPFTHAVRSSLCLAEYRRRLPNLLPIMSRAGLSSPWPDRVDGWTIHRFQYKLHRLLRRHVASPSQLAKWHVGFWIYIHERRPLLDLALYTATADLALRLYQTNHGPNRQPYIAVIRQARASQRELEVMVRREFGPAALADAQTLFGELEKIEIVFNEHGYHVHDGFVRLRELEEGFEPVFHSYKNYK